MAKYIEIFFSESPDLARLRSLLTDDFQFSGPLMSATSADDYVQQLRTMGLGGLRSENRVTAESGLNIVAILYDLVTPVVTLPTAEWFWLTQEKISRIQLINDPTPLLQSERLASSD